MMDKRWAQAPACREQLVLFQERLDEVVAPEHPIRAVDQCLNLVDWSAWERRYAGRRGQPPIHPRLMAGCILYGLMRGIRSSRDLEDATRERVDFIWFLERRTIDHSTFAAFRKEFGAELKDLNRQMGRLVCERHGETLLALVLDGTRIRANSDRHGARTAAGLQRLVAACVEALDAKLAALAEADRKAAERASEADAETRVREQEDIAALEAQMEKLQEALAVAQARDAVRREHNGKDAPPVRVPVSDPDAQVVPNKDGGYAPNYTPVIGVDPVSRALVYGEVLEGSDESAAVLPAVAAAEAMGGAPLKQVLADANFATGANLEHLEGRGTPPYMPAGTALEAGSCAIRPDPTQPLSPEQCQRLPKHGKHFATTAFVYDAAKDCYYCPMGRPLSPVRSGHDRNGVAYTNYACPGSAGCPRAAQCVRKKAPCRTVRRDQYQELREQVGRRMATEAGRAIYARRAPLVEGVFAEIKHVMGIRQFLLRGLENVRTEWEWICTAINLKRLLALFGKSPIHEPRPKAPLIPAQSLRGRPVLCRLKRIFSHLLHSLALQINHGLRSSTKNLLTSENSVVYILAA